MEKREHIEEKQKEKLQKKYGTLGKLTYMPVLIPNGYNKVMSEFTEEELEEGHREKAWRKLIEDLKQD